MFHFVPAFSAMPAQLHPPHHSATTASPFDAALTTPAPAGFNSFEEYDEYRSRQELEALIRGQEQRRQREAATLLARRRQQAAEQIRQQVLLRAQHEEQQRARYQALLEEKAAQLEQLRQQEEIKLRIQRELERHQAIDQAQQQQQQQRCLRKSSSNSASGCPARRRRQPLEHLAGLRRNQHPFAPFLRLIFDSDQDEQEQVDHPPATKTSEQPMERQVDAPQPAAASAPVDRPTPSEPQAASGIASEEPKPPRGETDQGDSLEDVLGSLFKSLFGLEVKLNVQKESETPNKAQIPSAKSEPFSPTPTETETKTQALAESSTINLPASDPVEVPAGAAQEKPELSSASGEASVAEKLQRHYQAHLQRRKTLATLSSLSAQFEARRSSFAVPQQLEFQPSPPPSEHADSTPSELAPKLAYKSVNAPFLAYEDFLVNLLSKIDEVQSGGDRTVKSARKTLVKEIEAELKKLDQARDEAWEKVSSQQQQENASDDVDDSGEPLEPLLPAPEPEEAVAAQTVTSSDATAEVPRPAATSTDVNDSALAPGPAPSSEPNQSTEESIKVISDATKSATQVTKSDSEPPSMVSTLTPDPEPVRLTPEALARLSSHAEQRRRQREDDDDSSSSTTTLSETTLEIEEALGAILNQARKLGEQVDRMEHAEV